MSPREIVHRLREQARRRNTGAAAQQWATYCLGSARLKLLPAFSRMLEADRPQDVAEPLRDAAFAALGGHFCALGQDWPQAPDGPWRDGTWLRDPVTGAVWPGAEAFSFAINYRHNPSFGDVKYVWEPGRLQFLLPVAALAARDRNPGHIRYIAEMLSGWMDANPPYRGIHWTSGIELALRLVSLAVIVAAVGDDFDDGEHRALHGFVEAHAQWLERFPSLYSSANNHRVAEGLGLVVAALLVPDSRFAARRLAHGRAIIEDAATSQFWPDGIGAEQSPTYAAFTLEMLCVTAALLDGTPQAFGAAWRARVGQAGAALDAVCDDSGIAPSIGDDDEGRVIGTSLIGESHYVASVAALAAATANGGRVAPKGAGTALRNLLATGSRVEPAAAPAMSHFPAGGYTIVRDACGPSRIMLVFDHGPLGFGAIAAHGHADALSIWLHVDGAPILVDAGTYLYHSGGAWREFFRSTAAHNTLEVAGLNQSVTAGAFNWRQKARARCTRRVEGGAWEIEGRHDGYRGRLGVDHIRRLVRTEHGFRVEDRLEGAHADMAVAIRYLVHPDRTVIREGRRFLIRDARHTVAAISVPDGFAGRVVTGVPDVIGPGWYSPSFGRRVVASCITFEGMMRAGGAAVCDVAILPEFLR
jgi:uncharacterized heparinase superfamily protein